MLGVEKWDSSSNRSCKFLKFILVADVKECDHYSPSCPHKPCIRVIEASAATLRCFYSFVILLVILKFDDFRDFWWRGKVIYLHPLWLIFLTKIFTWQIRIEVFNFLLRIIKINHHSWNNGKTAFFSSLFYTFLSFFFFAHWRLSASVWNPNRSHTCLITPPNSPVNTVFHTVYKSSHLQKNRRNSGKKKKKHWKLKKKMSILHISDNVRNFLSKRGFYTLFSNS